MAHCGHCGIEPAERVIRIRAVPRPGALGLYVVTDVDTGQDISGLVPATIAFDGALPSERVRGFIFTSDPAHVIPGVGEICTQPAVYEVAE